MGKNGKQYDIFLYFLYVDLRNYPRLKTCDAALTREFAFVHSE